MKKLSFRAFRMLPAREKRITLSTGITFVRIVLVPCIVYAMIQAWWAFAFWLFCAAALSDMFDGALARWRKEQTLLGACLDPIADKLLILTLFFTLALQQSPLFSLPEWFVWLVLIKELILIAGIIVLYSIKGHVIVSPTRMGKLTTLVQFCFIAWLFACYFFQWIPLKTYYGMLSLMTILVLLTLYDYARIGIKQWKSA